MPRTTIYLDDHTDTSAKLVASRRGISVSQLMRDLIKGVAGSVNRAALKHEREELESRVSEINGILKIEGDIEVSKAMVLELFIAKTAKVQELDPHGEGLKEGWVRVVVDDHEVLGKLPKDEREDIIKSIYNHEL